MNTRPVITDYRPTRSHSAGLNTTSTLFTLAHTSGFCIFHSSPCTLNSSIDFNSRGIGLAELLDTSNLLALVGGGPHPKWSQSHVILWDALKHKPVITLEFKSPVLRVRLTRTHIAVALHNSVHLFAFSPPTPPEKKSVFETTANPSGLLVLNSTTLAFPGRSSGKIQLLELTSGNVSIIPAHTTSLRALSLSQDGTLLASASGTGTLIRIFATSNCAKIAELRRGVDPALIFSIAISPDSSMLAVTSDKSTLHVFDLPTQTPPKVPAYKHRSRSRSASPSTANNPDEANPAIGQKWGFLSQLPLLPRLFSDTYSFASCHFEMGDDEDKSDSLMPLGAMPTRPEKGLLGWVDESTLVCISAGGGGGRWERFRVSVRENEGGEGDRRAVSRDGWRRILGS